MVLVAFLESGRIFYSTGFHRLHRRRLAPHHLPNTEVSTMYHYDPAAALEELNDDAVLPNPVHLRDMMLRAHLDADHSLEYNRLFVDYQKRFGELQKIGKQLLGALGATKK
jgi:hypothetical protein